MRLRHVKVIALVLMLLGAFVSAPAAFASPEVPQTANSLAELPLALQYTISEAIGRSTQKAFALENGIATAYNTSAQTTLTYQDGKALFATGEQSFALALAGVGYEGKSPPSPRQ